MNLKVRTLLDRDESSIADRRTARELASYNVDITALSETRLSEENQLSEKGAGYAFFLEGQNRRREKRKGSKLCHSYRNHQAAWETLRS